MKKSTKTLKLNRDTLRQLEESTLKVAGGVRTMMTACDGFGYSGCPHTCLC